MYSILNQKKKKMAVNVVEIVRKEMIKPSSPTPQHLKEHKLSFIDQTSPFVYIPLIFFYEANQIHGQKDTDFQLLKSSLSMALTHYYPLAGRVRDNYIIDCNDAGALFVEAKVDSDLLQVIKNPDMDDLKQLLPVGSNGSANRGEEVILAVQINKMDCGGSAIAVQMSHKLADGHSLVTFMNSWAAISRGADATGSMQPMFGFASIFPPIMDSSMNVEETVASFVIKEKIVTKRIVFDKEKLEILKHTAASGNNNESQINDPTRVEVVSALIWKHFMEADKRADGGEKIYSALQAVNLRPRMNPSLPDHTFGNLSISSIALHEEGDIGYQGLVGKLRAAINKVNETFGKNIQKGDEYFQTFLEVMSKGEVEPCFFSSWSRFPVYEVDYGWGKPVWVTTTAIPLKNVAILLSTKTGDGLEAWINMLEEDASLFATDHILNLSA